MAYKIIEIKNLNDLENQLTLVPSVPNGYARLYRGQINDYNGHMIPSLYRQNDLYSKDDYSWKLAGQKIIKEEILKIADGIAGLNDHSITFPINGLIQHYGLRSGGLDVTSDINIALWFSQFQRIEKRTAEILFATEKKANFFAFRKATYQLSDTDFSYLYIFDCPLWDSEKEPINGDCVDLEKWFGQYTSRPKKQKAWYIYADNVLVPRGDLQSFIKIAFKIPKTMWKEIETRCAKKTLYYFPLPTEDQIFERLLNSYFIKNDSEVFERVLDIPEYYNSYGNILNATDNECYLEAIRLTSFNNYFKAFLDIVSKKLSCPVIQNENINWFITDATLIKMEIPDWYTFFSEADNEGNFYLPKLEDITMEFDSIKYNYFIELSKYELVAKKNPEDDILRGVWIVQENNLIGFQLFYYGKKEFGNTNTIWYSKAGGIEIKLINEKEKPSIESKRYMQNSLVNALRVIQTYKKIPFFSKYVPFRLAYGE